MNTGLATVALLLVLDTNLLPQAGITHYSQLHDTTALSKTKVHLSLSKFRPPHQGFRQATYNYALVDAREWMPREWMPTESGEIPNYADSERLKTPKTDSQVGRPKNTGLSTYQLPLPT